MVVAVLLNMVLVLVSAVQEVEQTEILIVIMLNGFLEHQVHEKDRQILVVVEEENHSTPPILMEN